MKNSVIACLFMVVLAFTFGCKKDETPAATPGISVKFDGATWTSDVNIGIYAAQQHILLLSGTKLNPAQSMQIGIASIEIGTYTFNENDLNTFCDFNGMSEDATYVSHWADSPVGQIVITESDKTNHTISGTFTFDGYNWSDQKKTFTEGKFTKITYEVQ